MALLLRKTKRTGQTVEYWRLAGLNIDLHGSGSRFIVDGWKDAATRADPAALPDDGRQISVDHDATMRLAQITTLDFLRVQGVDVSAWPAPILEALAQSTLFNQLATAIYGEIQSVHTIIPAVPDQIDPETGEPIPGTGTPEIIVPGEFADAVQV